MTHLPPILRGSRRGLAALVAACAVGQAAGAGLAALATRDVFAALSASGAPVPMLALGILVTSGSVIALFRISEGVAAERLGQDYAAELRLQLFRHISRLPVSVVRAQRQGGLALRFVGDLTAIRGWVGKGVTRLVAAAIVLPVMLAVLVSLDPWLGLAAAGPLLLGLVSMAVLGWRMDGRHADLRAKRARIAVEMSERVPHAPELRLMGRMAQERRRLSRRTEALIASATRKATAVSILRALPDLAAGGMASAVLAAAFLTGVAPPVAAGALAACALMLRPMRDLAGVWDRYRAWQTARAKTVRLLERQVLPGAGPAPHAATGHSLEFQKVRHGPLETLGFSLLPGAKAALLGPNGSGKSVALMLASGLEQPRRGRVRISGRPATRVAACATGGDVLSLSTHAPLFAGSLRRALTMGLAPRPSDPLIWEAAERVGLGPVLARLGGLGGRISEGGRGLSRGEVWRIHIARALMADPALLLIDCPDRDLDPDGIAQLLPLIRQLRGTVLLATDDPQLAGGFDPVIGLGDGVAEPQIRPVPARLRG